MVGTQTAELSTQLDRSRVWFLVNAIVAWAGVLLQLVLTSGGFYPSTETVPSMYGYANQAGAAGAFGRITDYLSYFTIWSNIVVAVVMTVLLRRALRDTPTLRVLRLDSLMMIAITGLVYAIVLAPTAHNVGWQVPANSLEHQITPVLTIVVWLFVGPRGWIRWWTIPASLVLPLVWVVYTLLRGAVIGAYPYPFVDVVRHGYGQVLLNITGIAVIGLVVGAILYGIDALLTRRRSTARVRG